MSFECFNKEPQEVVKVRKANKTSFKAGNKISVDNVGNSKKGTLPTLSPLSTSIKIFSNDATSDSLGKRALLQNFGDVMAHSSGSKDDGINTMVKTKGDSVRFNQSYGYLWYEMNFNATKTMGTWLTSIVDDSTDVLGMNSIPFDSRTAKVKNAERKAKGLPENVYSLDRLLNAYMMHITRTMYLCEYQTAWHTVLYVGNTKRPNGFMYLVERNGRLTAGVVHYTNDGKISRTVYKNADINKMIHQLGTVEIALSGNAGSIPKSTLIDAANATPKEVKAMPPEQQEVIKAAKSSLSKAAKSSKDHKFMLDLYKKLPNDLLTP